jgi:hypothetical protein
MKCHLLNKLLVKGKINQPNMVLSHSVNHTKKINLDPPNDNLRTIYNLCGALK